MAQCFTLHTSYDSAPCVHAVVETAAEWDARNQCFILHTPYEGAAKNWISQGTVADYAVVMADLRVGQKSQGPHAFLMRMRGEDGQLVAGVSCGDMGIKTGGCVMWEHGHKDWCGCVMWGHGHKNRWVCHVGTRAQKHVGVRAYNVGGWVCPAGAWGRGRVIMFARVCACVLFMPTLLLLLHEPCAHHTHPPT